MEIKMNPQKKYYHKNSDYWKKQFKKYHIKNRKSILQKHKQNYHKHGRKYYNMRHRIFKARAVEYKGGKCSMCGYNKFIGSLDFHHVLPHKKEKSLAITSNWIKMKKELDKCILLCSNCHREVHWSGD
jgi:hypothetical protein